MFFQIFRNIFEDGIIFMVTVIFWNIIVHVFFILHCFFWVWSIKTGGCLLLAASSELSLLLAASYYASHRSFGLVSNTYVCSQQSERERENVSRTSPYSDFK